MDVFTINGAINYRPFIKSSLSETGANKMVTGFIVDQLFSSVLWCQCHRINHNWAESAGGSGVALILTGRWQWTAAQLCFL